MKMTDSSASRYESLSMYRYLCDHVVGSEDTVTTIRMLNTVRDNLSYDDDTICITSGSFSEGLEMRGSDLDIMLAIKNVAVYEDDKSIPSDCSMTSLVMEGTQHGFTKLRLARSYNYKLDWLCVKEGNIQYLSSGLIRSTLSQMNNTVIHGPCVSDNDGELDLTTCFHSKTWISPAHEWITRSCGSWPNREIKSTILDHGVLFVPIGVKCSPEEDLAWRISFSVGEKFLINSFCHTQLLCYALMKILLKDVISVKPGCKDLLCSFFIKNIIFWICEEQSSFIWTPDNLLPCFMECFKRLLYCVENSVCPHYFIPENNLFENRIEGNNKNSLLNVLYTLYRQGWRCILFSDQFCKRKFYSRTTRNRTQMQVAYLSNISRTLHIRRAINRAASPMKFYKKMIYVILRCVSPKEMSYYRYSMSLILYDNAQYIPVTSIHGNKIQYKQYQTSLAYLLQSIYHDAASGWIMLASLFFQTKQYKKVLFILSYVMTKFTPEKLYCQKRLSQIQLHLLCLKSIKDLGEFSVLKFMSLHRLFFGYYSTLFPKEIEKETKLMRLISPVVFGHLLSFLSHYHLNDVHQCRIAVRDLYQTIEENCFIACNREKARSYRYLGVALMLFGERNRAEQAFLKSTELDGGDDASLQYLFMLSGTHSLHYFIGI